MNPHLAKLVKTVARHTWADSPFLQHYAKLANLPEPKFGADVDYSLLLSTMTGEMLGMLVQ